MPSRMCPGVWIPLPPLPSRTRSAQRLQRMVSAQPMLAQPTGNPLGQMGWCMRGACGADGVVHAECGSRTRCRPARCRGQPSSASSSARSRLSSSCSSSASSSAGSAGPACRAPRRAPPPFLPLRLSASHIRQPSPPSPRLPSSVPCCHHGGRFRPATKYCLRPRLTPAITVHAVPRRPTL